MPETRIINAYGDSTTQFLNLATTLPADTNYQIQCSPGVYNIQLFVQGTITGATTTLTVVPYQDSAQTVRGAPFPGSGTLYNSVTLAGTAIAAAIRPVITSAGGGAATYTLAYQNSLVTAPGYDLVVPFGFEVAWVLGTTVSAAGLISLAISRRT